MTVINTNVNGLIGLNNLRITNVQLRTSLARLSSGLRINYGADDPSGLAIGKGMEAQISGTRAAIQNAEDGINLIHTADGALAETQDILIRMRDLAVRSANDATLTTADHGRLQDEFDALRSEITRKTGSVTFNSKNLFDGTFISGLVLQIGPDNGNDYKLSIVIASMTTDTLSITTATLSSATEAQSAITFVQTGLDKVSDTRAKLGIQERRLVHVINDLESSVINVAAARSRIMDADMAVEISKFTRLQILQQSGTAILAQANAQPQSILQLMTWGVMYLWGSGARAAGFWEPEIRVPIWKGIADKEKVVIGGSYAAHDPRSKGGKTAGVIYG